MAAWLNFLALAFETCMHYAAAMHPKAAVKCCTSALPLHKAASKIAQDYTSAISV